MNQNVVSDTWWVYSTPEKRKPLFPRHPRWYDHKPHRVTLHASATQGTFTKGEGVPTPIYGIRRALRRKMARVLKTKWLNFNLMLLTDPETVTGAYKEALSR